MSRDIIYPINIKIGVKLQQTLSSDKKTLDFRIIFEPQLGKDGQECYTTTLCARCQSNDPSAIQGATEGGDEHQLYVSPNTAKTVRR